MIGVTGWCSAIHRSPAGIVSGGTKALLTYGRNRIRNENAPALGRAAASGSFEDESREIDFVFSLPVALDGVESLIAQASK